MLEELRIRNFAIIDNLELGFAPGFNVITGETGAGKSIIIDAVELLLGSKADAGMLRAGAEKAVIEGVFAVNGIARELLLPVLQRESLIEDEAAADLVTLARELRSSGRSLARVNGVTVNQDVLREVGAVLVDIHGQSEHLSLLDSRNHLDLLDRFADLLEVRGALHSLVSRLHGVRQQIRALLEDEAALQRRADMLRREVEEIDAAALRPGEDDELRAERKRLANSEQLATLTNEAVNLLSGDDSAGEHTGVDLLMRVAVIMGKLAAIDPEMNDLAEMADGISAQAQELAMELAGYIDEIEYDPQRLNDIEERLELINTLRRRYGVTIELVLEHAEKAREELSNIEHSEERLQELREKETLMLRQIGELGASISKVRHNIGQQLARQVVNELKDLRMERTQFEVSLVSSEDPEGCYVGEQRLAFDGTGIDQVEFLLSANPGEPRRPLAKVASGG